MKKISLLIICILLSCLFTESFAQELKKTSSDSILPGRDGVYTGLSRSVYKEEPYWGRVTVVIKKGIIDNVIFVIRDSALHETFNAEYAKHFEGNPLYMEQTRNDWKGVLTYPGVLMEKQDIRKVDVITGATWSYNIFRSSFLEAIKNSE